MTEGTEELCYDPALDVREQVLARLNVILAGVPGVVRAKRNDPSVPEGLRPAVLMLDGDEDRDPRSDGRNHPSNAPFILYAKPEVYVMVSGTPEEASKALNELQDYIVKLVLKDPELIRLTKDKDGIRYEGARMATSNGRALEAEMALDFTFAYLFNAKALCDPLPVPGDPWLPTESIRERVLAAFARALAACEGVEEFKRNEMVTSDPLPAVLMLDGAEVAHDADSDNNRPTHGFKRVRLEPEVYAVVMAPPEEVGSRLNQLRFMLLRAVLNDALLRSLVHNDEIVFEALQSGLSLGRSMAGEMGLRFTLTYVLRP